MFFGLYIIATTVLFGSVPWSKFAHMFFKPAAAFEKGSPTRTAPGATCPPPPTSPSSSAVFENSPGTTERPTTDFTRETRTPCQPSFT